MIKSTNGATHTIVGSGRRETILDRSATGTATTIQVTAYNKNFQAFLPTSASGATVVIMGSLNGESFISLGAITLTSTVTTDALPLDVHYPFMHAYLSAYSGSGNVTVMMVT